MDKSTLKNSVSLIDPIWTLRGPEDEMYFQHDQDVNDQFLSGISDARIASANSREKNYALAADIPAAVVEKWKREGFDIYHESWKSIRKRLIAEDLGAFIATAKTL